MVDIERCFNKTEPFDDIQIDQILFDAQYPIIFSMEQKEKEYLVCCPVYNSTEIVWICTEIEPTRIIDLLRDKITIRDAFAHENGNKYLITLKNKSFKCELMHNGFPDDYLPTQGEFMEAEDGEFDEEINYYESKALGSHLVSPSHSGLTSFY